MRLRTGHGPNDWSESIPASTGSSRLGGELVVGGPGSFELQRIAHAKSKTALRGERLLAKIERQTDEFLASRARAKGYNVRDEYSVPIAHNAQRPPVRLYSESEGVDVPEYRRNG